MPITLYDTCIIVLNLIIQSRYLLFYLLYDFVSYCYITDKDAVARSMYLRQG